MRSTQTDSQTDSGGLTDRLRPTQTDTDRLSRLRRTHTDSQTHSQTDSQTNSQTDSHTNSDRLTDRLTD
jgi:hypothetical protein